MTVQGRGAALASARSIVLPRSATCGAACRAEPCTLREIRYAERDLDANPELVLWAELSVVGHLIGEPMPVLKLDLLEALARFAPRHRECALSHAVDAAVAVRTPAFATQLSPDALAVHVNDALNGWVNRDRLECGADCSRWRIEHPDWRLITHGADEPSRLETVLGCRSGDPAWLHRLATALENFTGGEWPLRRLGNVSGGR